MSNTLLNYFLAGSLGVLLQIFAVKVPSLKKQFTAANKAFSFKKYLQDDWYTIIASFLSVAILIFGIKELLNLKPELGNYIMWLFAFVGFTGSAIIQAIFSVAYKKVINIIDIKTNIADGVVPPITEENKSAASESFADTSTSTK